MGDQASGRRTRAPYGLADLDPEVVRGYRLKDQDYLNDDGMLCCLKGLRHWLPWHEGNRRKGTIPCGDPPISLRGRPTYIYLDPAANFIAGHAFMAEVLAGRTQKAEHHRLGHENSEDALTANVLLALLEARALPALVESIAGEEPVSEPGLFLWGLPIDEPGRQWSELQAARAYFEKDLQDRDFQATEPDAALHVPGQTLILIEAKFGSPNTGLEIKSRKRFLERYNRNGVMSSTRVVRASVDETPEQLLRNIAFADHMADRAEKPFVINLVREDDAGDIEERVGDRLDADCRVDFQRMTWESIFAELILGRSSLEHLERYMANKTYELGPAFRISPRNARV